MTYLGCLVPVSFEASNPSPAAHVSPPPLPLADGPPDSTRRSSRNEMTPRHGLLGQRWPPADEVDQPVVGEDGAWLSLQEQLGHLALPQPVRVLSRDRMHIGGLAVDGNLPGPCQRRP